MTSRKANDVSVKMTYRIHGEETESKTFDESNTPLVPIGLQLPAGTSPAKVCCFIVWVMWSSLWCWVYSCIRNTHFVLEFYAPFLCIFYQSQPQPGDYSYSGLHDAASMPLPREGGPMAQLISCVQQAKAMNDEYLTKIIEQEKEDKNHPSKKAKTETPWCGESVLVWGCWIGSGESRDWFRLCLCSPLQILTV